MEKEIVPIDSQPLYKLICPKCGTSNTFDPKSNSRFLYCTNCKYVYAWISGENQLTIERSTDNDGK